MVTEPPRDDASTAAAFDTYDQFIKQAIKDYYDRGWKTRKGNFVALVMASGQTMSLAKDSLTGERGLQRAAIGAGALVALRIGLAYAITGPVGILLTGLAAASLIAFFVKNQKEILQKLPRYRKLIADTRLRFEETQSGYRANRYSARERNLMVDGLLKRFLEECDAG
ncbi:MAG: hypothetical protein EXR72_01100 [Myxococcales bacterium]|nr:hypothetical protein [Myxococcales bacterium]